MNPKPFYIANTFTAVFLVAIAMGVPHLGIAVPYFLFISIGFYTILNIVIFHIVDRGNKISSTRFVVAFQGGVAIKLLSSIALVSIGLYLFPDARKEIALGVMIIYAFFTIALVQYMFKELRKKR